MQQDRFERARQYRFRAEELRTFQETWLDMDARDMLGRIARDYDRMADNLDTENQTEALGH
jgi:hypothetical protein